ncbi:galactitol 2-dehydrogenase [Brucella sp. NBRC 12952]|uniref:KR domain protein n=1 Tax=Brucella pseudogrignonensis TaxID=419475 RepID=A0A256G062_9HYPH|nr:SDR family oxidoreductase [Brucella pseudogrignonensis]EMG52849.1 short-chain dehydrogenase/reductase SDR [Ochrobactrum sp. CDB2]NNV19277.1 SDR family oxidoreductase [Brucella pseudogrignonensis]OYR20495.1 KR domain protein [Brucella pseudogrignonensis]
MTDIFSVKDRVAVVTGGLGQLGTQFSKSLAEAGAKVAIFSRRPFTKQQIAEKFPGLEDRIRVYEASVTDKVALEAATKQLIADWGVPHVLVNNAGIDSKPDGSAEQNAPFEVYPQKFWDEIIDTNLTGVMLTSQVIGSHMASEGRGSIINVGSIYGLVSPNQALYSYREKRDGKPFIKAISYAASKSGLINLTRYLGTYWGEKNVRVNLISFGGVKTASFDKEFIDAFLDRVPMRRQAEINEYNGIIRFLASDASSYMTGSNVVVDGGFTAW